MKHFISRLTALSVMFWLASSTWAFDLEVSLSVHSNTVYFLDPLFVEVTITNRGTTPFESDEPDPNLGAIAYEIFDGPREIKTTFAPVRTQLSSRRLTLAPGQSVAVRDIIRLGTQSFDDHPFWSYFREHHGSVSIVARYSARRRTTVQSKAIGIKVIRREDAEFEALESLRSDLSVSPNTPSPPSWGLPFHGSRDGAHTREVAKALRDGALKDLLLLCAAFQETYAIPPEMRESNDRHMATWLARRPALERRVLREQAIAIANAFKMTSTESALSNVPDE